MHLRSEVDSLFRVRTQYYFVALRIKAFMMMWPLQKIKANGKETSEEIFKWTQLKNVDRSQ